MELDAEEEEVLALIAEGTRNAQEGRDKRRWLLTRLDSPEDVLDGPDGLHHVHGSLIDALLAADLLTATGRYEHGGLGFILSPAGRAYYAQMKKRAGEALHRQEHEQRRFLDSVHFRGSFPRAYARWTEAEALLWDANSDDELTTVGHKTREAMQEFATALVNQYQPPDVERDAAKVTRRLGAVIAGLLPTLGESRGSLLTALGDYWEALNKLVQRQEHGGQKEGEPLSWEDARRVVFQTAVVMFEVASMFRELDHAGR